MAPERCAAHPARPAVDRCPVCDRPRCGADVRPQGCALCTAPSPQEGPVRRPAGDLERLVRAALASFAVALAGGGVTQQYIEAPWLQYFAPAVLGVVCASAAVAASGHPPAGRLSRRIQLVAAVCALGGQGLGVLLEKTFVPLATDSAVLVPYALAAGAAWLWAAPPKPRRRPAPD